MRGITGDPQRQFLPLNLFLAMLSDTDDGEQEQDNRHAAEEVHLVPRPLQHQAFKLKIFCDHAQDM